MSGDLVLDRVVRRWKRVVPAAVTRPRDEAGRFPATLQDKWASREIVLAIASKDPSALKYVSDPGVMKAVVEHNPLHLEHASDSMRASREVVLAAVRKNGWALLHAAPEQRMDIEILRQALMSVTCSRGLGAPVGPSASSGGFGGSGSAAPSGLHH